MPHAGIAMNPEFFVIFLNVQVSHVSYNNYDVST